MPSIFDGGTTSVDTLATTKANTTATDTDHPAHHNDLADAVNKMQLAMPRFKSLAADGAAVVGTAYANAGLSFPVDANVVRRYFIVGRWTTNATGTGARFALNGPTLTNMAYLVQWNSTGSAITTTIGAAYDAGHTVGTAANASASNMFIMQGHILCSVAGEVHIRASAEIASPGSVTLLAGSSVLHW